MLRKRDIPYRKPVISFVLLAETWRYGPATRLVFLCFRLFPLLRKYVQKVSYLPKPGFPMGIFLYSYPSPREKTKKAEGTATPWQMVGSSELFFSSGERCEPAKSAKPERPHPSHFAFLFLVPLASLLRRSMFAIIAGIPSGSLCGGLSLHFAKL